MENLPTDIIEDILPRLSIESTLQSKRVCRTWRNLIGKNKTGFLFAYANVNNNLPSESGLEVGLYYGEQYNVNLDHLSKLDRVKYGVRFFYRHHMVGSCNGLLCLSSYNKVMNAVSNCICNPVTGEFLFLPDSSEPYRWQVFGFGYIPSTNEYKVVRCSYRWLNGVRHGYVEVYTLGSQNGWREKGNIPYEFYSPGLFANGAIHWIEPVYKIVAYDLANEKFKYVSSLPFNFCQQYRNISLKLLGEKLCLIHYRDNEILDIWAFQKRITDTRIQQPKVTTEEYYDQSWRWSKEFSMSCQPNMFDYKPFAITKSSEVLLWHEHNNKLYCYDNNTSTLTAMWNGDGTGFSFLQAIPHMNSLVSLKDLGESAAVIL